MNKPQKWKSRKNYDKNLNFVMETNRALNVRVRVIVRFL